jgi:hypothetical protein
MLGRPPRDHARTCHPQLLTIPPLRCPSAQWATATQPAGGTSGAARRELSVVIDSPARIGRSAAPNPPVQGICSPGRQQARPHSHVAATASPAARPATTATTAMAPPGPAGGDEDLHAAVGRPLRAWPTSRPSMTSGPRPALACGAAPPLVRPARRQHHRRAQRHGSATEAACSGRRWPRPACTTSPPGPAPQINGNMERFNRIPLDLVSPHDARTAARSTGPPHREPPRVAATPGRSGRRLRRGRGPWRLVGG